MSSCPNWTNCSLRSRLTPKLGMHMTRLVWHPRPRMRYDMIYNNFTSDCSFFDEPGLPDLVESLEDIFRVRMRRSLECL